MRAYMAVVLGNIVVLGNVGISLCCSEAFLYEEMKMEETGIEGWTVSLGHKNVNQVKRCLFCLVPWLQGSRYLKCEHVY